MSGAKSLLLQLTQGPWRWSLKQNLEPQFQVVAAPYEHTFGLQALTLSTSIPRFIVRLPQGTRDRAFTFQVPLSTAPPAKRPESRVGDGRLLYGKADPGGTRLTPAEATG